MAKKSLEKYKKYAKDVVEGKVVSCYYIFKACERYLSWFDRDDIYFDSEAADKVVRFFSKLHHFKGAHAREPFILEPWQLWITYWIYGFKRKKDKLRVVRNVYISVPRKNGKSALCAGFATYHLTADKEAGASVIIGASSATQAQMMFEVCQKFLQPFGKVFKRYRDSIKFPAMDSKLQVVSSNVQAIEGENASAYFIDEIEMQPDSKLYDTLSTSTVARTQPVGFVIGTAGFDTDSFAYSMIRMHKEILDGTLDDDSSIGIFYEPDEGENPYEDDENRTILKKCNPNLDVSCRADAIDGEMKKAKNNPRLKASVLMRHFDMWQSSAMEWIPEKFVLDAMVPVNPDDYTEESFYLGFDLSAAKDLTCLSMCIHSGEKYIFKNWYYCSEWAIQESVNKQLYQVWAEEGYINVCQGRTVDYDYMHDQIEAIGEKYFVAYIGYDPWNAVQLSKKLTDEGKPMVPYGMNLANMNRPMKEFEVEILNGNIVIDKNPVTKWCIKNTCLKIDRNENIYPVKTTAENKIDGTVAILISYGVCLQNEYPSDFVAVGLNNA